VQPSLADDLAKAGYYPELVSSVIDVALANEPVDAHLVHVQTTFDEEIRRHLTVLLLTPTRLITAHVDDHEGDADNPPSAAATTEAVPLREIRSVGLTHLIAEPAKYHGAIDSAGQVGASELNIAISWGVAGRIELEQMDCGNPDCEGEHGVIGQLLADDLVVRVASAAEGPDATAAAIEFARKLSAATARAS